MRYPIITLLALSTTTLAIPGVNIKRNEEATKTYNLADEFKKMRTRDECTSQTCLAQFECTTYNKACGQFTWDGSALPGVCELWP